MHKFLKIALLAFTLIFISPIYSDWEEFLSINGNCKVLFPESPQHAQKVVSLDGDATMYYDIYATGFGDDALYFLIIAHFPKAPLPDQELISLEGFVNGVVYNNKENSLQKANFLEIDGHKAVDFTIQSKSIIFEGRAIIAGDKMYLLARQVEKTGYKLEDLAKFLKSFHFLTKN